MAIRCRRRRYHRRARARVRESERDSEPAPAMAVVQVMDQGPMEIWALVTTSLVAAIQADRSVMVVQAVIVASAGSAAVRFSERACYRSRNRSTRKTRDAIRLRGRWGCAWGLRVRVRWCRSTRCERCRLG